MKTVSSCICIAIQIGYLWPENALVCLHTGRGNNTSHFFTTWENLSETDRLISPLQLSGTSQGLSPCRLSHWLLSAVSISCADVLPKYSLCFLIQPCSSLIICEFKWQLKIRSRINPYCLRCSGCNIWAVSFDTGNANKDVAMITWLFYRKFWFHFLIFNQQVLARSEKKWALPFLCWFGLCRNQPTHMWVLSEF